MEPKKSMGPEIKILHEGGLSYNAIVELMGCSKSTVAFHINKTTSTRIYVRKKERHRSYTDIIKTERGGKCEICSFDKSFRALHFHHRVPADKSFQISKARGATLDAMRLESNKCALVCGNCHTMIHQKILPCPPIKK